MLQIPTSLPNSPKQKPKKEKRKKKRKFKKKQNILNAVLLSDCHLACNFCDARRRRRSGSGCLQTERLPHVSRQQLAGERLLVN
jgi:MoaA/NifB/PqqE/SkfB family radical SAM enzyme